MIMLLGFAAIAVDLGFLYYTRTRLNVISTAAAQAGYEALVKHRFDYNNHKADIDGVIREYMKQNGATDKEVTDATIVISPRGQVRIQMSTEAPLFFARVITDKVATAVDGQGELVVNNIAPFAVPTTYQDPDQDGIANWKEADETIDTDIGKPWRFKENKPYIIKYGRVEGMSRLLQNHVFIPMDDEEHWVPLPQGDRFYLPAQDYGAVTQRLKSAARKNKAWRASADHGSIGLLRAYGVAYDVLGLEGIDDAPVNWLLGYDGGSFLISKQALLASGYTFGDVNIVGGTEIGMLYQNAAKTGVRYVDLSLAPGPDLRERDVEFLGVLEELRGKEKIKALQISYQPQILTFTEGEDHVTQAMFSAGIPFTAFFLEHMINTRRNKYHDFFVNPLTDTREQILANMVDENGAHGGEFDWLHVHHEDFANPYVTDTSFLDRQIEEVEARCEREIARRVRRSRGYGCDHEPQTEWFMDTVNDADGVVPRWKRNYYVHPRFLPGGAWAVYGEAQRERYNTIHSEKCAAYRNKSCLGYDSIEALRQAYYAAQEPYTKANLVGAISDFVKKKHKFLFAVCWANEHLDVSLAQLDSKKKGLWLDDLNSPAVEGGNIDYSGTFAFENFFITKRYQGTADPWNPGTKMGELSELNDVTAETTNNSENRRYYLADYLDPLVQNHLGFRNYELDEESGVAGGVLATRQEGRNDFMVGTKGRTNVLKYGVLPGLHSSATTILKKPVVAKRGETIPEELLTGAKVIVQSAHKDAPRVPAGDLPGYQLDSTKGLFYLSGIGDDDDDMATGFGRWAYLPGHDPHKGQARSGGNWGEWVEACVGKTYEKDRYPRLYEWYAPARHGLKRNLDLDGDDIPYKMAHRQSSDRYYLRDLVAGRAARTTRVKALPNCRGLDPLVDYDTNPEGVLADPWCCDDVPETVTWVQDPCVTIPEVTIPAGEHCWMENQNCVETAAAWDETIPGETYDWYTWPEKGGCGGLVPTDGASCPTYYPAGQGRSCPGNRAGECTHSTRTDPDRTVHHPAVTHCDRVEVCQHYNARVIPEHEDCPDPRRVTNGPILCERVDRVISYGPWVEYLPDTKEYKIIALPGPNYDNDQSDVLLSGCVGDKAVYQKKRFRGAIEGYRLYLNNILFGSTVELSAGGNSIPNTGAINPAGLALGSDPGEYGDTHGVSKNSFSATMFIGTKGIAMPVGAQFTTAPGDNVETAEAGMDNMTNVTRGGKSVTWEDFKLLSDHAKETHRQVVLVPIVERIPEDFEEIKGKSPAEQDRILKEFQGGANAARPLSIYAGDTSLDPGDPRQARDLHIVGYARFFVIDKANQVPDTQDSTLAPNYVATEWRKGEIRGYFLGYADAPPGATIYPAPALLDDDPR
jgi:hypothetical protein